MQTKNNLRSLFCTLLLLFCAMSVFAQQKTITGTVRDSKGETLIGVSVAAKDATVGAISDIDGKYTISVPSATKSLVFSYIGMKSKEIAISGSTLDVTLLDDFSQLDEVVVVGYGTMKRRDLTGSVASVDDKTLKNIPVTSALEAISGRMAGVNITTTEGSPDAEIKIRVRGGGSITQDNSPLYIVDGFQVSNISDIAPGDIQSIDVLKDAASTAIYGSQGANGVVIVTTKSGKEGKITVNLNAYVGFKKAYNLTEVLSPYEYVYYQRELDPGESISTGFFSNYGIWDDLGIYKAKKGNNWQDKLYGNTGVQQNYNASITGGNETTRFNLSYTHADEDYIMLNSKYKRDNISFKLNTKINKNLDFDFSVRFSNADITGPSISNGKKLKDAVKYAPVRSLVGMSSELIEGQDDNSVEALSSLRNPIEDVENEYKKQNQFNTTFNAGLTWKIIKPLRFRTQFSYAYLKNHTDNIWTSGTGESSANGGQPVAKRNDDRGERWSIQNTLTYSPKFHKDHSFDVMVGQEMDNLQWKKVLIQSKFYPADMTAQNVLDFWNKGKALPTYTTTEEPVRLFSFFGRINYSYLDKYLLTLTAREDGKNAFSKDNLWGFFPGMAVAWRIGEESFMENTKDWLSNLKLRLSYGSVGNARVASNHRKEYSYETNAGKLYYPGEESTAALKVSNRLYNEAITWETTISTNIGLDFGFFNERLSGTLDIYRNKTKDLLMDVPLPSHSGYTTQYQNVGQTSNKGVELSLNGHIVETKDFTLSANFNISFNRNKIDKYVSADGKSSLYSSAWGLTTSAYDYLVEEGKPIGQMYGYVTDGMYSFSDFSWDELNKRWSLNATDENGNTIADASTLLTTSGNYFGPGHLKLKDLDGDGEITEKDRKVIGNAQPKHTGGFGINATWKGFDLSALFNWSFGNDIYNANKIEFNTYSGSKKYQNLSSAMRLGNRFSTIDPATGLNIYHGANANPARLQEINQNASIWHPIINSTIFHSWAVEDGSFLRLSNLTLGYTLPKKLIKKLMLQNLRVYATGYNLHCWTSYSGQDPEVDTRRSTPLTPGVDYSAYPKSRSFVFGVNITF
ncbi:TonB-dependent receptor [Dysgonomonas sp. 520]|uniref:SusC/RagA family TonB-linked outer membrane protein n=1 Tax=Dysgonomonas sp. 520 TaxID=2302931 RepID=UPI0013D62455|nr:TonB-dependent receptor [Dysgonomonas sp. 520]NDW08695.1 TonB-dependent receptor [Dysgonomonas sp. 520]